MTRNLTVNDGDAALRLGDLTVEVSGGQAPTQPLDAIIYVSVRLRAQATGRPRSVTAGGVRQRHRSQEAAGRAMRRVR